jgi:hypothetical protein
MLDPHHQSSTRAISIPPDPPEPRLPEGWPQPPPMPDPQPPPLPDPQPPPLPEPQPFVEPVTPPSQPPELCVPSPRVAAHARERFAYAA